MGELESRLNELVEILRHDAERGELVSSFCHRVHITPERISDLPGVEYLLLDLAHELEFHVQDPVSRLEVPQYYGNNELAKVIAKAFSDLKTLGVTLPKSANEFL